MLTYWASQQSPSLRAGQADLGARAAQVHRADRDPGGAGGHPLHRPAQRILTATTSGNGPDVLNIGNTWTPSLQATGALLEWDDALMDRIGGADRFEPVTLQTSGRGGHPAGRRAALHQGVPALLQQEAVRGRGRERAARHLGRVRRDRQAAHQGHQRGRAARPVGPRAPRAGVHLGGALRLHPRLGPRRAVLRRRPACVRLARGRDRHRGVPVLDGPGEDRQPVRRGERRLGRRLRGVLRRTAPR